MKRYPIREENPPPYLLNTGLVPAHRVLHQGPQARPGQCTQGDVPAWSSMSAKTTS